MKYCTVVMVSVFVFIGFIIMYFSCGCSKKKDKIGKTPSVKEDFSHYPPSRVANEITVPELGYSSVANFVPQTKEEFPKSGIDIFGSGYSTLYTSKYPKVSQVDELPKLQFSKERGQDFSPSGVESLLQYQRRDSLKNQFADKDLKEGYINKHLNRDDSVPKHTLSGDFTQQNEARIERIIEGPPAKPLYLQNPMEKDCYATDRDDPPRWPLNYSYPYRDPLFKMMTTGLYTAQNSDPEDLKEQRLWPKAY